MTIQFSGAEKAQSSLYFFNVFRLQVRLSHVFVPNVVRRVRTGTTRITLKDQAVFLKIPLVRHFVIFRQTAADETLRKTVRLFYDPRTSRDAAHGHLGAFNTIGRRKTGMKRLRLRSKISPNATGTARGNRQGIHRFHERGPVNKTGRRCRTENAVNRRGVPSAFA